MEGHSLTPLKALPALPAVSCCTTLATSDRGKQRFCFMKCRIGNHSSHIKTVTIYRDICTCAHNLYYILEAQWHVFSWDQTPLPGWSKTTKKQWDLHCPPFHPTCNFACVALYFEFNFTPCILLIRCINVQSAQWTALVYMCSKFQHWEGYRSIITILIFILPYKWGYHSVSSILYIPYIYRPAKLASALPNQTTTLLGEEREVALFTAFKPFADVKTEP